MKVLASIVSIILYFVLAWAIKDIFLSTELEWVQNINAYDFELLIASITGLICGCIAVSINCQNMKVTTMVFINGIFFFGGVAFIFSLIPISMGGIVIFNIINIAGILFTAIADETIIKEL